MSLLFGGLDLSLTSTGVAHGSLDADGQTVIWTQARKNRLRGYKRLDWIVGEVLADLKPCDIVGVEGLITHAIGQSLTDLAGLWWIVTRELTHAGIRFVPISPPTLKKWATGNGTSDKYAMFAAALKRFGPDAAEGPDQADALWAAAAVAEHYGQPLTQMPKMQVDALHAIVPKKKNRPAHPVINWPELEGIPGQ